MADFLAVIELEVLFIAALLLPLLVQLSLIFLISRALWSFTGRVYGRGLWALLAGPGVIIHELSHAMAFLLTGAGVRRMVLFAPRGLPEYGGATGVVVPARNPGTLSRLVASIAPFFGCSLVAWLTLRLLLPALMVDPPDFALMPDDLADGGAVRAMLAMIIGYLREMIAAVTRLSWADWRTYLALFLGASLGMGAAPSTEDLKLFLPALAILLVLLLPIFALIQLFLDPQGVLLGTQAALSLIILPVGSALSYATLFALLALAILLLLAPFRRLWR